MRALAVGLLSLALVACGSPAVPATPTLAVTPSSTPTAALPSPNSTIAFSSGTATATPTATPTATLLVECLDATYPPLLPSSPPASPPPNFCAMALPVVLAALAGRGGVPATVVFDMGAYCPTPGSLQLDTTCPGGVFPPSPGGQSLGHALVSFAGTAEQAYLNLWAYPISRTTVTAELVGLTVPVLAPSQSPS